HVSVSQVRIGQTSFELTLTALVEVDDGRPNGRPAEKWLAVQHRPDRRENKRGLASALPLTRDDGHHARTEQRPDQELWLRDVHGSDLLAGVPDQPMVSDLACFCGVARA